MAFLAPSLVQLRNEVNARFPGRDRKSDGWIGDADHKKRKSDHNPDAKGCVHAIDVDKDGINPKLVVSAAIKDPRTAYVIFNRKIYSRGSGFRARKYTGKNPHTEHLHVSILRTATAEVNAASWRLAAAAARMSTTAAVAPPRFPGRRLVHRPGTKLMQGSDVRTWQARMLVVGRSIEVDGVYGPKSAAVARAFQQHKGLEVDGIVGPKTWEASWT
jgi:hypothetical protein